MHEVQHNNCSDGVVSLWGPGCDVGCAALGRTSKTCKTSHGIVRFNSQLFAAIICLLSGIGNEAVDGRKQSE